MCARLAWNMCVGNQVLQRWRLRYFASAGAGWDSLFFLILGIRGAVIIIFPSSLVILISVSDLEEACLAAARLALVLALRD